MAKLTVNEKALRALDGKVDYDSPINAWFKPFIDNWLADRAGPMPTPAMLAVGALSKKRGAGTEAGMVAMQLRDGGCTIGELRYGFNCGPAHNHTDTLVDVQRNGVGRGAGYFDRTKAPSGQGNNVRFGLTFTPKGEQWLADAMVAAGLKAAPKAKAPAKGPSVAKVSRKRNQAAGVAATETPTSEAPTVTTGYVHADGEISGNLGIEGAVTSTALPDGSVVLTPDNS